MEKNFFEVFPTLTVDDHMKGLLEMSAVERVTRTRRGDLVCVYLQSPVPIEKRDIWRLEKEIAKQLFDGMRLSVQIRERFLLSAPYTPESFLKLYEESFLQELRAEDPILHTLYRAAKISFPEETKVSVSLEDGVVSRQSAPRLIERMEELFRERASLDAKIDCDYFESERASDDAYAAFPQPFYAPKPKEDDGAQTTERVMDERRETDDAKESVRRAQEDERGARRESNAKGKRGGKKQSAPDPNVIYGRAFSGERVMIDTLDMEETGDVIVRGQITSLDERALRNGKHVIVFGVYDGSDSINVKVFATEDTAQELTKELQIGAYVGVRGAARMDSFDREIVISFPTGIMRAKPETPVRQDAAEKKRVELHLHTQMSDMDAVSSVGEIVNRAYDWGMPAIAITDHGVVQSLTEAGHVWDKLYKKACDKAKEEEKTPPDRQDFFKIIPGMECYLVDDEKTIVTNGKGQRLSDETYVVFDLETTGFSPRKNRIIEIGAVKIENGKITDRFSEFVNPKEPIPYRITELTSITDAMVMDADPIEDVLPRFVDFAKDAVLVGHNVAFDISFINENCKRLDIPADYTTFDTLGLSRTFFQRQAKHTLDAVAKTLKIELKQHHRAVDDAEATAGIFLRFLEMLAEKDAKTVDDVNALGRLAPEAAKHLRPHHAVLLATNTLGRVNLYSLVSESHLHYYRSALPACPLVPTSLLRKYREGLLVGSADAGGDLWQAVAEERSEEEIARLVRFYDYLEVQPDDNYDYMIDLPRYENIHSKEDIREINRRIVALGERYKKLVVATSDAHFLDPEGETFRSILVEGKDIKGGKAALEGKEQKGVKKDDAHAPLYLRTTDEMLRAFSYLGEKKAMEIVVDNTRLIADMCDSISAVRPDKCAPVIADSDKTLRQICYEKAHEIYGDPLPDIVEARLEKELTSIIGNGFAVMYIIAQKLVWKSLEDGYIVGSRGSVGSSFVAFAAGITEVNALPPHYVCPDCKYSDFTSDDVRQYAGNSGCDMPDKTCPVCGAKLKKDGFDIPFETFLGFHGEKEPDIDLNFSGEYQSTAHKYTEEIFGKGQTYRAGTVSALQDKTAYGVVKKYLEYNHVAKRKPEIDRLVRGLSGVRHGTGQHPGGIIVLPIGENINSFTPVQRPANKVDTDVITTHYDYHSIDHNLLKLDILGHDDPTMVRFLYDATGIDPTKAPLDDPEVMRLFMDTSSLHISPEQIGGTKLGCLGLPEFGTDFAMQMVLDAKPTSFSHLIRIAGLAHGTDVWLGNARDLILDGVATIDTAICNRDDIMNYLIHKGVDPALSFNAMESVRKGKGLTDEMKTAMLNAQVPDWYIDSCIKIKYMFPKAHATAYVMNAWRLAWFKVHEPLAFYAAWLSIRAKAISYVKMCQGKAKLSEVMASYMHSETELSDVQKNELYAMRVIQEMHERGFEFMPIDIFRAKAEKFQVIDGRIMPSLVAIDGMGPVAAQAVYEAAQEGAFLSRDDFRERTKCPQTVIDTMNEMGLLGDIPESNQMSLFDLMGG